MPLSAFVVKVPAAESIAADLRRRFDPTVALGVPAHITLLVPFMDPALITSEVLARARRVLQRTAPFSFVLGKVGRFPETAYLAPEPAAPFIAMTRALAKEFPEFPPYDGAHDDIVAHLSVAHGNTLHAQEAAIELQARLLASGPVQARCTEIALIENTSGQWMDMHVFPLTDPAASLRS